jgi:uncharacterized repeat protein (TIGR01451 family)
MIGRRLIPLLACSVLLLSTLAGPSLGQGPSQDPTPVPPAAAPAAKIDPILLKQALTGAPFAQYRFLVELAEQVDLAGPSPPPRHEIVSTLQDTARRTQAQLLAFLQARQAEGRVAAVHPYWIVNAVAATADADTLLALAARPDVRAIRADRWRQWLDPTFVPQATDSDGAGAASLPWNIERVEADRVWDAFDIDGQGVTIGVMDTGVDWQHPALQSRYRGYKPGGLSIHEGNWFCATDEGLLYPVDNNGHGTHVTGSAVGGEGIGVAPGARWIAVKVFNSRGFGYDSWVHAAFEWLMAPAGNPDWAPDVVNGSWTGASGELENFRPDLQALRAAGIVPVFASGNFGPNPSTIRNPASYPETIAVGASDDLDQVTSFSSRGPSSPWHEVKPEVVAPGIDVYSALPGGTYATGQGTSMATPHVAGVAALLLQADPGLTVDGLETFLTSTASPVGSQVPNDDAGWGRIDAYGAVAAALDAGTVAGQVRDQLDQVPIADAEIGVYDQENSRRGSARTGDDGTYAIALPAGQYRIHAEAFGFDPAVVSGALVSSGLTTTVDFELALLPHGVLRGHVLDGETGAGVGAVVNVLDTPASTGSDPATGAYSLTLPASTYTVEVERNGYRRQAAPHIDVLAGQTTTLDFALTPAPTLLLVDSGWWYYESEERFFRQALDDRGYVHDVWQIRDLGTDVPALDDLSPYEVTIWSSPFDAPGLIGAGDTISDYLGIGGNLFLTGQDVGFWDDGLTGFTWHEYYGRFLKVEAVSDDAGRGDLLGQPGGLLHDLTLPINGPDSAQNQYTPDSIALLDPRDAEILGIYADDGSGASRASGCQSYRAIYLAAGLEGLGDRASRAEVMDRALDWLSGPPTTTAVEVYPPFQDQVWSAGADLHYLVELRNLGQATDQFALALSPSNWPASVWDMDFATPISHSDRLEPCDRQTVGVKVTIPAGTGWNASEMITLTARSLADPAQSAAAAFASKTPAPILLVDDHRWHDPTARYRAALEANDLPYDAWLTDVATPGGHGYGPPLARMQLYPMLIWFTASDWYSPLAGFEEAQLAAYLDGGGRLLFSSQDYLAGRPYRMLAEPYFGVPSHVEDLTVTQVVGSIGNPVSSDIEATELYYPFSNRTGALRFSEFARPALWGQHSQPVALTLEGAPCEGCAPWKTAFFAFPLEALPEDELARILEGAVDWLSPLGDSSLAVDRTAAGQGDPLAYELHIANSGPQPLSSISLSNTLPLSTAYIAGSLEGPASYDPGSRKVTWNGGLPPGEGITIRYRVLLDTSMPDGALVRNRASLSDETGLELDLAATTRVDAPELSGSVKAASRLQAVPGMALTYTLSLRNDGVRPAEAELVDPFPLYTVYPTGTASASSGVVTLSTGALVWRGAIAAGDRVTVTFTAVPTLAAAHRYIYNRAKLADGWGTHHALQAYTWTQGQNFLPVVLRTE